MTWLTVPEPPLALRPIQPHSRSYFPHMVELSCRDYTRLYSIAKEKIKKC